MDSCRIVTIKKIHNLSQTPKLHICDCLMGILNNLEYPETNLTWIFWIVAIRKLNNPRRAQELQIDDGLIRILKNN